MSLDLFSLLEYRGMMSARLEELACERVETIVLHQAFEVESTLRRDALIYGASTGTPYIYARSIIDCGAVGHDVLKDLVGADFGIGVILQRRDIPSRRRILEVRREPASPGRRYAIDLWRNPAIVIEEEFLPGLVQVIDKST